MEKNYQDFSMQEAMRLASSPAGRQLLALLRQSDSAQLNQAMSQAAAGDYSEVQKTMSSMLSSPEAQALLKQLRG